MAVVVTHAKVSGIADDPAAVAAGEVVPSDWNANHTLTGVGTMAEQNANAVAITGGTIDGTSIGATTASSGAFTYGSTNNVTSTTPALSYNASNSAFVNGATVAGSYLQNVMQNKSSAANSSTNFAVSNNLGTDSTYYGEFGMNSSGFSSGTPSDFFSLNNGIYFSGHDGDMSIGSGNGFKTYITWGTAGDKAHVVNASGAIGLNTNITGTTNFGTSGQLMQSAGSAATPTWSSALTGLTIDNSVIGGTAAAAGTFTTLIGGGGSANYEQITGGATGKAVQFQSLGTDTNISLAIQSKGTGAIDLAAGSSGVNISNGGTVTALTRTATGTLYTTVPTVAISAPTTAGGVQATATANLSNNVTVPTITSGGTGYTVGDTLTLVGGTFTAVSTLTVSTVSSGVITGITVAVGGVYSVVPTNPMSVTGGTGSGATFTLNNWGVSATFTITNAGSGYVEQPTVTFSGGGGSGAAAYATVGSATIIRSLSNPLSFYTPGGEAFRIGDAGVTSNSYFTAFGGNGSSELRASGPAIISSVGAANINFRTNTTLLQFLVSNTASAVNYVQVTGAATGAHPTISSQGSDANARLVLNAKGTSSGIDLLMNSARQMFIGTNGSAVNYFQTGGTASGIGLALQAQGSDTNISQVFQSKGTGAIDLAAGSSGVNISNGGTVTALTVTFGATYTVIPTVTISAPTTAGGVQATGFVSMQINAASTIAAAGTGYAIGDTITLTGGTFSSAATLTVATLSGSGVATFTVFNSGTYTALPTNPIATTSSGAGTGFQLTGLWTVKPTGTITVAGSGYVEQPTVTFSSGTAAAYATVGAEPTIRSLFGGATTSGLAVATSGGTQVKFVDASDGTRPIHLFGGSASGAGGFYQPLSGGLSYSANSGAHSFYTNGRQAGEQMRVSVTASAVNYVQVTGATTASKVVAISAQGSDTDVSLSLVPKGLGIVLVNQQTPTAVTATGTLTIANLLTQIITSTSAVAVALTLPTGTLSDAGVSGGTSAVNTSFNWSIINTGSAVGDVTLVAGTAHTIVGSVTVAVGTTGSFRSRKTATNTFVTYRV